MTSTPPADAEEAEKAALLRQLATGPGRAVLNALPPYTDDAVLSLTGRLRDQGWDAGLVAAALTQSRLRARAGQRLGPRAHQLLLTADGLEQATRPAVAARHAERFVAAGVEHVWDLGCGLGLDALALAEAGLAVTAVERAESVAVLAAANLAAHPRARVLHADATDLAPGSDDGAWLDPARRTPGVADIHGRTRRLFKLADLSPSWDQVQETAARAAATGAKLSPGFSPADRPPGAEAEWVSLDGDVVECVVWWRAAVRRPGVSAVVGSTGPQGPSWLRVEPVEAAPDPLRPGEPVGPWLAEPDKAVLAAGLTATLAAQVDGAETDPGTGYVVAPTPVEVPWARWFTVEEVLPLRAKTVRAALRGRGVGRVTIKKRGVSTDVERFRAELRLTGGRGAEEATLVLTRVAGQGAALVVRPTPLRR